MTIEELVMIMRGELLKCERSVRHGERKVGCANRKAGDDERKTADREKRASDGDGLLRNVL